MQVLALNYLNVFIMRFGESENAGEKQFSIYKIDTEWNCIYG